MARGLSELQKTILRIAYRNHLDPPGCYRNMIWRPPDEEGAHMDVFPAEVLVKYYGWEIESPLRKTSPAGRKAGNYGDGELDYSARRTRGAFSKKHIGAPEYEKGYIAVTRAFDRLDKRGLLDVYIMSFDIPPGRAAMLTEAGIEKASQLMVNSGDKSPQG